MRKFGVLASCIGVTLGLGSGGVRAETLPEMPRIDSLIMLRTSPLGTDPAVIWYDDFDGPQKPYTESQGKIDTNQGYGGAGGSMLGFYEKGTRGVGNRKVFFGDPVSLDR